MAVEKFSPGIKTASGNTIYPKGWEWVLGFALAGCDWAIELADKPEFRQRIAEDIRAEQIAEAERHIAYLEAQLDAAFADLQKLKAGG
jgi:hypothetical protein